MADSPHGTEPDRTSEDNQDVDPAPLIGRGNVVGGISPGGLPRFARWPRALKAFSSRDYRLIWSGALVSNVGSWMQNVAQAWLVYDVTKSATWLGIDAFASDLPVMLLLPLGGVMADRFNRRSLLIWSNMVSGILAAILAVMAATGFITASNVGYVIAVSALRGVADAVRIPANQSLMPLLVKPNDLTNAIALNSMQFNLSRAVGPALAGITLVHFGAAWCFAINAISFFAIIGAFVWLHNPPTAPAVREPMLASLRQGLMYVRGRIDLQMMMGMVIVGGLFAGPVTSKLLPVVAEQIFSRGATGYSQLVSCFGIGAVLGAILLAMGKRRDLRPWMAAPMLMLLGVCQMTLGWGGPFALGLVLTGLAGAAFVGALVRLNSAILHSTPDEMRGRVTSFHVLSFRAGAPLGGLAAGLIAGHWGIRWALWLFGAGLILLPPLLVWGFKRRAAAVDG